jgi:dihydrofolate reductase
MIQTALIVARADNGVIGVDNQLPWNLPSDLKYLSKSQWGNPL